MTTGKTPSLRRTIERALLARDRMEIATTERLLALLKIDPRRTKRRVTTTAARDGRRLRQAEDLRVAQINYVLAQSLLLLRASAEIISRDLVLPRPEIERSSRAQCHFAIVSSSRLS